MHKLNNIKFVGKNFFASWTLLKSFRTVTKVDTKNMWIFTYTTCYEHDRKTSCSISLQDLVFRNSRSTISYKIKLNDLHIFMNFSAKIENFVHGPLLDSLPNYIFINDTKFLVKIIKENDSLSGRAWKINKKGIFMEILFESHASNAKFTRFVPFCSNILHFHPFYPHTILSSNSIFIPSFYFFIHCPLRNQISLLWFLP